MVMNASTFLNTFHLPEAHGGSWSADANIFRKGDEIESWPVRVPINLVTDNESTFAADDGQTNLWQQDGHKPLRKKRGGRSIPVRNFLSDVLSLSDFKQLAHSSIPKKRRLLLWKLARIMVGGGIVKIC